MDAKYVLGTAFTIALIGAAGAYIYKTVKEVDHREKFLDAIASRRRARAPGPNEDKPNTPTV